MLAPILFVLGILASPFKAKSRLEAENAALRQQLIVLRRKVKSRPRLANTDRCHDLAWTPDIGPGQARRQRPDASQKKPGRVPGFFVLDKVETENRLG